MVDMNYNITIGSWKVNSLLSAQVRKSEESLSDTATIQLPGMAYGKTLEVESKIKRGDDVVIELGYNDKLNREFRGKVSSIGSDNTITIECEDGMFDFRKKVENKQYVNVTVSEVIRSVVDQIGGYSLEVGDGVDNVRYDKFTSADATGYDVLKKIKEETSLHIFVKDKTLCVYLKYTYKAGEVRFDFSKTVEESDLKYINEADKKVEIEVIGINKSNEKTTVMVGEKGGDKITVNRYNVTDEQALKTIGEEEIKKYRYTGYEGEIKTWLFPYCTYGYSAELIDPDYLDRKGIYYVSGVTTDFDENGGSRKVQIGIKVA